MTTFTIKQLEKMLIDTTPGPWSDGVASDEYSIDRDEPGYDGLCWSAVGAESAVALVVVPQSFGMDHVQESNAALIASAPTLATAHIAALKRVAELEAENERLTEALAKAEQACDERRRQAGRIWPRKRVLRCHGPKLRRRR